MPVHQINELINMDQRYFDNQIIFINIRINYLVFTMTCFKKSL